MNETHKITIDREFWKIEIENKDRKNSVRWNNLLYDFYNALKGMGYFFDEETQEKFEDLIGDGDELWWKRTNFSKNGNGKERF